MSQEHIQALINSRKRKPLSEEQKLKLKKPKSVEHKEKIKNYFTGLAKSKEHKENISKSRIGKKFYINAAGTVISALPTDIRLQSGLWRPGRK